MRRQPVARAILALALLALAALAPAGADPFGDGTVASAFTTLRAGIVARVAGPYQSSLLAKADRAAALAVGPAPNVCASVGALGVLDHEVAALARSASTEEDAATASHADVVKMVTILFPTDPIEPADRCLPPNPIVTPQPGRAARGGARRTRPATARWRRRWSRRSGIVRAMPRRRPRHWPPRGPARRGIRGSLAISARGRAPIPDRGQGESSPRPAGRQVLMSIDVAAGGRSTNDFGDHTPYSR